ncbi:MAG: NAD(P)H-hydrate dehydratase [Rubrivivax sp.]
MQRVLSQHKRHQLHSSDASSAVEAQALATHAPHELMQRAGTAVAKLAQAVAPHARSVWVLAGPGNNGGDGLVAAHQLQLAGWRVRASLLGNESALPPDAAWALNEARQAGVTIDDDITGRPAGVVIDALLGLGASREPDGKMAEAISNINQLQATRLSVDLPSGLNPDTGQCLGNEAVIATHTLALLTLKPGLFTAAGRDHAGDIWFDTLGVSTNPAAAVAMRLAGSADLAAAWPARPHASHKGSNGEVAVVGGAPGMTGAALLASRAALAAGAGKTFVAMLDDAAPAGDADRPELMFRRQWWLSGAETLSRTTVVCGCGGGAAVAATMPVLLSRCARLVLDADALNALAADAALRQLLDARAARGHTTVLTPHPLEAARLLGIDVRQVQTDRVRWARELSQRHGCVALLKGSGSVIAAPDGSVVINPTGNALLATAGTGDVLAGWLGGLWAQRGGNALQVAVASAWLHGRAADLAAQEFPGHGTLRAGELIKQMRCVAATTTPS